MHWARFLAAALILLGMSVARADVAISTRPTQNMTCSGGVCTPTAKKAVLNVGDLANMLASGDATVQSGSIAQDIEIDAALSWTSTHRLTLDSYHSITFNKPVVVAGNGAMTITTGNGGDFRFVGKGHVELWDLGSSLIINGDSYRLEDKLSRLARDVHHGPSGKYALAKSINVKNRLYFEAPIPGLTGTLEGLGNRISNLTINADANQADIGLIGSLALVGSTVRDIELTNVFVAGSGLGQSVGTLVGLNEGTIANCHATGSVTASNASPTGGLVGFNLASTIRNSFANVAVSTTGNGAVGGLVGQTEGFHGDSGRVEESYATGSVSGGDGATVGGLVGESLGGVISDSYAMGSATGGANAFVGGLVGTNIDNGDGQSPAVIDTTYSTGMVSGGSAAMVGGLIGQDAADSQITNSYWDMTTSGISDPHQGAGNIADDPGITGLTTEQFKSGLPAGFSPAIWKEKANINNGYPYLMDLPPG